MLPGVVTTLESLPRTRTRTVCRSARRRRADSAGVGMDDVVVAVLTAGSSTCDGMRVSDHVCKLITTLSAVIPDAVPRRSGSIAPFIQRYAGIFPLIG